MQNKMKTTFALFVSSLVLSGLGIFAPLVQANAVSTPYSTEAITPFQQSVREMIESAKKRGEEYPDVKYESKVEDQSKTQNLTETRIVSKTIVEFEGPEEAGKDRWDNLVVAANDPAAADQLLFEGNLTQMVIEKYPELYGPDGQFVYGQEPRTLEVEETITITEQDIPQELDSQALELNGVSTNSNIVMGFTYTPPAIDYTIGFKWTVLFFTIAEGRAGFFLDAGLGLRLPANVDLNTPESFEEETTVEVSTLITPLDFGPAEYEQLGIPARNGNEAFADFELFVGAKLTVVGIDIINWAIDEKLDLIELCSMQSGVDCGNFVTPFGKDENGIPREFPIPEIKLDPNITGLKLDIFLFSIGVGLKIDPDFGSDKITADWLASQGASGSGVITYVESKPVEYGIGPINVHSVNDSNDAQAKLTLDNFKFHLTRQTITFGANIQLSFLGFGFFKTGYFDLLRIDLAKLLGEPAIGQHKGTEGLNVLIPIAEAAPALSCGLELNDFTIIGTPGDDIIQGTPGDDIMTGLGGDDVISGLGGNDVICGDWGSDTIEGGENDDLILGAQGNDLLLGNAGDDLVIGGEDDDKLKGNHGNDALFGWSGNDELLGGFGTDRLAGGDGNDLLRGSFGRDLLIGGEDSDSLFGGPGDDVVQSTDGVEDNDSIDGGADLDVCSSDPDPETGCET